MCYVQVMKYEDQVEKLKLENTALSDTVQKNAGDMLRQEEQTQNLELELTISQEKHRTCQQEVSCKRFLTIVCDIWEMFILGRVVVLPNNTESLCCDCLGGST